MHQMLTDAEPRTKRWSREEFYELAERGYFRNSRVQLLDGEIIEMAPQGHPHSLAISYLTRWAVKGFGDDYIVRIQMPLNASVTSDPEPDVAVVPGPLDAYRDHPETAVLVIEVADSSIKFDRRKAKIYAEAGVPEYWIVNVQESQIEVYRRISGDSNNYGDPVVVKAPDIVAPLARPASKLSVVELF